MDLKVILKWYENPDDSIDMKEFWHRNIGFYNGCELQRDVLYPLLKQDLGLFFWDRGGKQFVEWSDNELEYVSKTRYILAEEIVLAHYEFPRARDERKAELVLMARDFLDCLACLGEDKVKELIKGLK